MGGAGTCTWTWEPVGVTLGRLSDHCQLCPAALIPTLSVLRIAESAWLRKALRKTQKMPEDRKSVTHA